jgi:glycolate oxidase
MERARLVNDMIQMFGSEKVLKSELERYTYTYDSSFASQQNDYYPMLLSVLNSTTKISKLMKYAWEKMKCL